MRSLFRHAPSRRLAVSLVILLAAPLPALASGVGQTFTAPLPALASGVGQTFTVPQCVSAAAAQDLMADLASPDDCVLGTTGGPFTPNPGNAGFLLLKQGGHIILQQGGMLECHC